LYGGKVLERLRRMVMPARSAAAPADSPRLRLWQDPQVQQLLQPSRLLSTQLLDAKGVENFLERSRRPDFAYSGQWAFLLTLECTLQRLQSVTREIGAEAPATQPAAA
jgi:hypothetical protein